MNEDNIQILTFEESVRKRPYMYIGNEGVIGMLNELVVECIKHCQTSQVILEIIIEGDNDFILGIKSQQDLNLFIQRFSANIDDFRNIFPRLLKAVSKRFEIISKEKYKKEIYLSFDKELFTNTSIDYLKLSEKMIQIAVLNRNCEIITIDKRHKYLNQNYYHFPQGIFYLFDRATTEVLGKPEFILTFDGKVNSNIYQIGLAYRTDWYPSANIASFANDVQTVCGGSLVDGVIDGLISACKIYVNLNNLTSYKIIRKKFVNGLILICTVRGDDFIYGGSWKETLEDKAVKKEAKKVVEKLVLDFFEKHNEMANKFLWRFDTTQLTNDMY